MPSKSSSPASVAGYVGRRSPPASQTLITLFTAPCGTSSLHRSTDQRKNYTQSFSLNAQLILARPPSSY